MPDQTGTIYQLKIQLRAVDPPIWRRLLVRGDTDLEHLHEIFQIVMGWGDDHLYAFSIRGVEYSDPETVDELIDEVEAELAAGTRLETVLAQQGQQFHYDYDFSDDWEHVVEVEAIRAADDADTQPRCLDGARACPPEDVGGPEAYQAFIEAYADPSQPDHRDALAWAGEGFDAEAFDRVAIDAALAGRAAGAERA